MNWQDFISSLYLSNLVWLFVYLTSKLIFKKKKMTRIDIHFRVQMYELHNISDIYNFPNLKHFRLPRGEDKVIMILQYKIILNSY